MGIETNPLSPPGGSAEGRNAKKGRPESSGVPSQVERGQGVRGNLLLALLFLAGCHRTPEPTPVVATPPPPRTVALAAGTPVKLVLLDELTSGGSDQGQTVHLALAEGIDGLIAMSHATATVSTSRTEGTLGAFMNRPARLNLTLGSVAGPDGTMIPLSADPKEPKDVELNRGNTGRPDVAQREPEETDVAVGTTVQGLIETGESGGLDPKQVGDLARKLGMVQTARLADAGRLGDAQRLVQTIRQGGTVAGIAGGGTVAAAMELVGLAGDVGHRLGRSLGGRNIRAYPGTIIPAYVARDTVLTPLPSGGEGQG